MSPSDPSPSDPSPSVPATTARPTSQELAAIVAAVDAVLSRPVVAMADPESLASPPWRFSGRWWTRPVAARRDRPW